MSMAMNVNFKHKKTGVIYTLYSFLINVSNNDEEMCAYMHARASSYSGNFVMNKDQFFEEFEKVPRATK